MKLPTNPTFLPLLLATTLTTPANAVLKDDLTSLKESIASATNTLTEFRNESGPVNTAGMIQSVGWQVGAVLAGVGCVEAKYPSANGSNITKTKDIEKAYNDYISSLSPLSTALSNRSAHLTNATEPTLPVIQQIQSLTRALYTFGKCLYNGEVISSAAAIETWNAEGELLGVTSEWEGESGSGMRKRDERLGRKLRRESCASLGR
ncbi:hypothetical protein PRZ48_010800 [Zasmidium cellare]|uniref:Uncharacterized protein n=1 Tax=Zasmidium cellare TaxID=395010 RepID=A0ABR0E9N2_ZASCE|nr:hypothetical protein PRZ48_010800 [Zasmidium cellare]